MAGSQDTTEKALRAVMDRDGDAYDAALDALQPGIGPAGKLVLTIYLCKAVQLMRIATRSDMDDAPESLQRVAAGSHPISINWGPQFAERFSASELEQMWGRFEFVDTRLLHTEEHFVPGYQSGPMKYFFEDVADPFSASDFVASWG